MMSRTLACVLIICTLPAVLMGFVAPPEGEVLPDYDIRRTTRVSSEVVEEFEVLLGHHHLAPEAISGARTSLNADGNAVRFIRNLDGNLTGPGGGDVLLKAEAFIREHRGLFSLSEGDLDHLGNGHRYETRHKGVSHVFFQQSLDGIDVHQGFLQINVARDGAIIAAACSDTVPLSGFR
ncbi:hypothetical protein ACFLU6_09025, partial [Acidobacteriota bacterium]